MVKPVKDIDSKKRKREVWTILLLGALFLILTVFEFRIMGISRSLPFVHSIFFFGLVNFNIIVFLLLMFLIFRNIVKSFAEKEGGIIGSSLRSKLIAAFVGFSFVPTALMFLVSVFYINNSFDKWFSEEMVSVLKNSLEVNSVFVSDAKEKNYHFANQISSNYGFLKDDKSIIDKLESFRVNYKLDAVEYYRSLRAQPLKVIKSELPDFPAADREFLKKGIVLKVESSTVSQFDQGNLVQVIVPIPEVNGGGALVVSSYLPLSLLAKIDSITTAYENMREVNPLELPLKSIYLVILVLMTLVIMLAATWFGFYLAKQLSIPLVFLSRATQRVAKGDFRKVDTLSGSTEINGLVRDFNTMTDQIEVSQREVSEANANLRKTLEQLDQHSRYIEVVLSNVSTGVVSVDKNGIVTMINRHAAQLLNINADEYIGRPAEEVVPSDHLETFSNLFATMHKHRARSIEKEIHINIGHRPTPFQMKLTVMRDDKGEEIGKVVVFDDLTVLVNAQRSAAWREVARRIAHEIKNPLTPIRLSAQRLQRKFGGQIDDPAFSDCTSMIMNQVDDLKELVNEFNQFARLPRSRPFMNSLNACIEEALLLFSQAHKGFEIDFSPDETLPDFLFDREQIKRVVTNLVDNAISALQDQKDRGVSITTSFDHNLKIARISVIDNGPGIPLEMRDRIFEPYVTTKSQGTGLGLAIVKRTVEDHNGFIRAFANEPTGTKIVIELPVVINEMGEVIDTNGSANQEFERESNKELKNESIKDPSKEESL